MGQDCEQVAGGAAHIMSPIETEGSHTGLHEIIKLLVFIVATVLECDSLFFKKERLCLNRVNCALKSKMIQDKELVWNCLQVFQSVLF